jgi:nitroimidazol reductase NimA-like FMN-containing flavoprotein (pyridoxamine 5'-phosphate oxidase superfamily)
MRALDLIGGTELMSEEHCWEFLASEEVGRVAEVIDGRVEIFPVNYGLDGHAIIFRTNAGLKMAGTFGREVAFEVDRIDETAHLGWSVVIHGDVQDITSLENPKRLEGPRPWSGDKDFLLMIRPRSISGRRVSSLS